MEDVLSCKESRDDIFFVRSLYLSFTRAYSDPFPWGLIWRSWALMRVGFFCLGSVLEENFDHRLAQKRGDGICRIRATCVKRKRKLVII